MTWNKTAFGPFEALLQGGRKADGFQVEKLAMAGRRAAQQFIDHQIPLNDSLVKEASSLEGAEREHIQRMCETANHTTFNGLFAKMAGDFRAPDFEVADASAVWDRLGNGPTEKTASVAAPARGPSMSKVAAVHNLDDYRRPPKPFHRSRGAQAMEKAASISNEERPANLTPPAFPMAKAMEQRTKLSAVRDEIASRAGQYELSLASTESALVSKMAQALKEGHAPEELLVVFGQADGSDDGIKHASRLLVSAIEAAVPEHRHGQIKLAFDQELTQRLMVKEANTSSPLYQGFASHAELREKLAVAKVSHARVCAILDEQRQQLVGMLQEKEAGAHGVLLGATIGTPLGLTDARRSGAKSFGEKTLRIGRGGLAGGLLGHAGEEGVKKLVARRKAKKNQSDAG